METLTGLRMREEYERRLDETAAAIRRFGGDEPRPLIIVSGSGQAGLGGALRTERRIAPEALPHLPSPRVAGHAAGVILGELGSLRTVFFSGRVHLYEGWQPDAVVFAVRVAGRLGGKILLLTNAAGGVNPDCQPGDLVLLTDLINLTGRTVCRSVPRPVFDPCLCDLMRESARHEKINLKEGVYAGNLGPTYETGAEARMLAEIGADIVGMSTALEALAARGEELRVAGISCVANRVSFLGSPQGVTHAQVVQSVGSAVERLRRLIGRWAAMVVEDASR